MMKGLLLVSEGIDSPVAGKLMADRGMELYAIHYSMNPLGPVPEKVLRNTRICATKLFTVPHRKLVEAIIKNCDSRFICILCKRMMLRVAELLAKREKCSALVTGDNLGQVASQTLENMTVVSTAVKIPILRPLLCNDKEETITLAKKFGTYETSVEKGHCCTALPPNPRTFSTIEEVEREEKRFDAQKIAEEAAAEAKEIRMQ